MKIPNFLRKNHLFFNMEKNFFEGIKFEYWIEFLFRTKKYDGWNTFHSHREYYLTGIFANGKSVLDYIFHSRIYTH